MKKRVICLLLMLCILFTGLTVKLFNLSVLPQNVAIEKGVRTKEIDCARGTIFDRNMKPLTNNDSQHVLCVNPSAAALKYARETENEHLIKLIQERKFIIEKIQAPDSYSNCKDMKIIHTYNRYKNNSLCHVIGYIDATRSGVCGIERFFNTELDSYGGTLSVTYSADAKGHVLTGEDIFIKDEGYYNTGGIKLTIDSDIQILLENALASNNIEKGAGIVLDTKSNEILACASLPVFDRNNLSKDLENKNAPFINRAFSAYPVGSVFKVVTAAASLENNVPLQNYNCKGHVKIGDVIFNCNKTDGHGNINFIQAVSKSCNAYFIDLGMKIDKEKILSLCKNLRLGKSTDFGNGYKTDSGILPEGESLLNKGDVANFSFGQGRLTATPLQMAAIFSVIANNGYYIEPTLIHGFVERDGKVTETKNKTKNKILSDETCTMLKKALEMTSVNGTGISARSKLFDACTKTATAQSGQYDEWGNEINMCWFVGFFPKENPQYTICILKEGGSSGGSDCGPVFKEIAEAIYSIS